MKIKYCMNCWGTGTVPDFWDNDKEVICPHCNGTGREPPLINDEWRRICSAEEFAEWISNLAYACMRCGMSNGKAYCHTGYCIQDKEDAEKWLKEKHRE